MISGAHVVLYSTDAEADRKFFRNILKFPHVDAGNGWLIFALPPAELAVHPSKEDDSHGLFLMCDDIKATIKGSQAEEGQMFGPQCSGMGDDRHDYIAQRW